MRPLARCCTPVAVLVVAAACTTTPAEIAPAASSGQSSSGPTISVLPPPPETVEEVVDSRTVLLSNGLRARVLGLAAPGECWSAGALKFAKDTLLGKQVRYSRASESVISVRLADNSDYATLAVSQGAARAEKDDPVLTEPEKSAAKTRLGLWGAPCNGQDTTPPPAPPPPPPPPPTTSTTTAPPVEKKGCAVTYRVAKEWPGGFHVELVVRNHDKTPVTRWVLHWKFTSGQQIKETWGGRSFQRGSDVVAMSQDGNGSIGAGGEVSVRFNATTSGPNVAPTTFTLNGVACSLG